MSVFILTTGGTLDKDYNEIVGDLFINTSHVPELLKQARCLDFRSVSALFKDSTEMTNEDRSLILEYCQNIKEKHVVITHGTDTMTDTAEYLASHPTDKTIVLTGAMIPSSFKNSDILFNLGTAIAFSQTLPPDVYIAMNGKCFNWYNVKKDRDKGVFVKITNT